MTVADLTLFGTFGLRLADGRVADLPGQKDRALLAILALNAGTPQSRERLAGLLWSDRGEAQARDSLKHALTRIRQCLGDALVADRQTAHLDPGALSTDVVRFERLVREGTPESLAQACALCSGDLLDGIGIRDPSFEDWLQAERQRLRRLHEEALTGLLPPALPITTRERAARRLLALDPLREAASRALIQIHLERGETAQAVKLFENLRDRLHVELGVKPEPETARLYEAIRRGRAGSAAIAPEVAQPALPTEPALPSKPSIAVLPFQNLSGDPEQEYFADGMVEEIITALSRMRWLFVIARNSSFTYKGRAVDVKQVGRELSVRYVLEGSVRKAGNRVRITGQLVDAQNGIHLWADHFDGTLADIFDLQDEVAAKVASAIAPQVEEAEIERARRKRTDNLDAYDYYLRGLPLATQTTRAENGEALRLFCKAIELDQDFAAAHGMAAWCYMIRKVNGWMIDTQRETAEATRLARRGTALGRNDAVALCWGGFALAYVTGDLVDGAAFVDQAIAFNPNLAAAWDYSGWLQIILGNPGAAIERLDRARRLNPLDRTLFHIQAGLAWAHFFAGDYGEACQWVQGALRDQPNYVGTLRIAAASLALAGQLEQAHVVVKRMRELDPGLRLSNLRDRLPPLRPQDLDIYQEGLRRAGLPD